MSQWNSVINYFAVLIIFMYYMTKPSVLDYEKIGIFTHRLLQLCINTTKFELELKYEYNLPSFHKQMY